jgi:hypothetical protein
VKINSNTTPRHRAKTTSSQNKPSAKAGVRGKVEAGFKKAIGQGNNLASVSMNLRIGSRQLRSLLGTGLASSMGAAGMYVGLGAAGLKTVSGVQKLVKAAETKKISTGLDGIKDLGSALLTGFAAASMVAARMTVLPIYAGFNTFRGLYTIASGVQQKNKKRQFLGLRRTVSSAGLAARSMKKFSPALRIAGVALAPVAGALQAGQGVHGIVTGLREDNNRKELRGLVDIASATGLTLFLTGIAGMPGLALFGTANFLYSAYTMNSKVRQVMDKVIDKMEPSAKVGLDRISKAASPLKGGWERIKGAFDGDAVDEGTDADNFLSVLSDQDDVTTVDHEEEEDLNDL